MTTRVVSVRDGKVDIFPGGFADFARSKREPEPKPPPAKAKVSAPPPAAVSAEERKRQHETQKRESRDREKQKKRVKELEDLIAAGEKQLGVMRAKLREDPGGDWAKLAQLAAEEQAVSRKVEQMMAEWEKLSAD